MRRILKIPPVILLGFSAIGPFFLPLTAIDGSVDDILKIATLISWILAFFAYIIWPSTILIFIKFNFSHLIQVKNNIGLYSLGLFILLSLILIYINVVGTVPPTSNSIIGVVGSCAEIGFVPSLLAFFWSVGSAVSAAEGNASNIGKKIVSFFQIFWLPIGVFFLHPRLETIIQKKSI